jgi:hypothetical protein
MNTENQRENEEKEPSESQSSTPENPETEKRNKEDQNRQPTPQEPEDTSAPKDKNKRPSGARKLRDLVAESLNIPGWSVVREFFNNLEDRLENDDEEGKPEA